MRPLWLELMLTPMGAPETRWLRAMRMTLVAGLVLVAAGTLNLDVVVHVGGRIGTGLLAGLCLAMAMLALIYAGTKLRADARWIAKVESGKR